MNRSVLVAAAIATAFLTVPASAQAHYELAPKPKVSFFASGSPGFLSIEGKTEDLTLADDGQTLTFTVPMATVDTGIPLRDEHMRDTYVQVAQFPDLVLALPRDQIELPAEKGESRSGTANATFTVHGVTHPVTVSYTAKRKAESWTIDATFAFDVGDYGIAIPSYMGITIDPAMHAEAVIDVTEQP